MVGKGGGAVLKKKFWEDEYGVKIVQFLGNLDKLTLFRSKLCIIFFEKTTYIAYIL